jgi:long-chain acyl-CoA synthetase
MIDKDKFRNFSEVLKHWSAQTPDKIFIRDISQEASYTFKEFNDKVNAAARLLKSQGVGDGDIISVCIPNSSEFLMIYFASIRIGGIINPFPSTLSIEELQKTINIIKPKIIFLEKSKTESILVSFKSLQIEFSGKDSFANILRNFPEEDFIRNINENKPACLYYSSGTTLSPKGILYSHRNMIELISSICRGFGHTSESVHFGMLPMGHTAITNYQFLPALYSGGSIIFSKNFLSVRRNFWKIIEKFNVNYVQIVPTILFSILNTKYSDYSKKKIHLKYIGCGSAPLPIESQKAFKEKFGIPVANLYGLSETGPTHFDNPLVEGWEPGSIGYPLDVNECIIVDDKFNKLPYWEVGEIAVKGPNVFIGYYEDDEEYKKAMRNGYFLTGDLGYKDRSGKFFYVERKKDLIIKGGVNIFPGEIDEILFKHPSILEASTIGVPDKLFGEEIISFVSLKEPVAEKELKEHCSNFLQRLKIPKKIIFLESLPKTPSGKLLRKELKLLYKNTS